MSETFEKVNGIEFTDGLLVEELLESARERASGPAFIEDAEMKLAALSFTFVDDAGVERKWSVQADGYHPDEFGGDG